MFNMFRKNAGVRNLSRRCVCPRQNGKGLQCKCTREILDIKQITYDELLKKTKEGAILIDTRTKQEFLEGHLDGAILMPYYEISRRIENIIPNKDQIIIVYCQNGGRSIKASEILIRLGYVNVYNLKDGIEGIK